MKRVKFGLTIHTGAAKYCLKLNINIKKFLQNCIIQNSLKWPICICFKTQAFAFYDNYMTIAKIRKQLSRSIKKLTILYPVWAMFAFCNFCEHDFKFRPGADDLVTMQQELSHLQAALETTAREKDTEKQQLETQCNEQKEKLKEYLCFNIFQMAVVILV